MSERLYLHPVVPAEGFDQMEDTRVLSVEPRLHKVRAPGTLIGFVNNLTHRRARPRRFL